MKLKRRLGFWDVFCIAAGAMISSGLFILPGFAFIQAGPAVVLSYAIAGIIVIPALMSQAELVTAMPRSGGSYFFIERSMGALPGTLAGLANWLSLSLKSAFALIGIGAFTQLIWPGIDPQADQWIIKSVAIACCVVFAALNIFSVKGVGRVQILMVAFLLGILGVFIGFGMPTSEHMHFANFMDRGFGAVLATAGLVFVSFGGLTKVASVAEEVHRPGRNIPAGMFAAMLVVTCIYVATVFVTVGVLDSEQLSGNLTPISHAAEKFLGEPGLILLSVGAMLAFITTANGGILAASRSPMAMSRDGLLPERLQRVSRRFGTPHLSIILTAGFMITVIALLDIQDLVKAASTMMLMLFVMVNMAVLIMRRSRIQNYRPIYRAPFYPWLQIAGITVYLLLIADMGTLPLMFTGGFAAVAVLWYFLYTRGRINRESALVYMVKNIASRAIYRSELEEELKEIALERDEVIRDRFDRLIGECEILDIEDEISAEQMFQLASQKLASRLGMDKEKLMALFQQRESQSSTVVEPGVAIPHIIIDGEKLFDILLIRCRKGVLFPNEFEPVRVGFVLAGTRDERNYHLRALMAIAQIVQEKDFRKRWLDAPNAEHLRDLLLLSDRKRETHRT